MNDTFSVETNGGNVTIKCLYGGRREAFVFYASSEKGAQLLVDLLGSVRVPPVIPPQPNITPSTRAELNLDDLTNRLKDLREVVKTLDCVAQRRHDALLARVGSLVESGHNSREAFKAKLDKLADRVTELEQRDPKCLFDTLTEKTSQLRADHGARFNHVINLIEHLNREVFSDAPKAPDKLHDPERIDRVLAEHSAQIEDLRRGHGAIRAFCDTLTVKLRGSKFGKALGL